MRFKVSLKGAIQPLAGCRKTPICGVALVLRHCGVLNGTPHSSGFRAPCIWTFFSILPLEVFRRLREKPSEGSAERRSTDLSPNRVWG